MPAKPDRTVFVDVDTQADFMLPDGKLYVPGAETIIPNLKQLMRFAQDHGIPVVSSADAHAPDDPEFAQFPVHCVRGTPGQAKIPETLLPRRAVIANREQPLPGGDNFSQCPQWILEKQKFNLFTNVNAAALLEKLSAGRFVVFGVATEYCVRAATLGLLRLGRPVALVTDAIRGIYPAASGETLAELQGAGAQLVNTQDLLTRTHPA